MSKIVFLLLAAVLATALSYPATELQETPLSRMAREALPEPARNRGHGSGYGYKGHGGGGHHDHGHHGYQQHHNHYPTNHGHGGYHG